MNTNSKPSVFMIMPFSEDFLALFDELKSTFANSYELTNAGDMDNQQNIMRDIVQGLAKADVVIADLTGLNANVFYELGLAHAMNKKVIIITQDIGELPFDIKAYRAYEYSMKFYKITRLIDEIEKCLSGAITGEMKYGNPVSDFSPYIIMPQSKTDIASITNTENPVEESVVLEPDDISEMGFLDYLSDFHESTTGMNASIVSMGADVEDLGTAIENSVTTLNRVKSSSKTLDPSFVRNTCRKLAMPVKVFAEKVQENTESISAQWDRAENCYLAMLDDKHIQTEDNINKVKEGIDSLRSLQQAIDSSNTNIEGFVISLRNCLGFERQLNKSLTVAISEVEQYLSIADSMRSSVDRMISKSLVAIELWNSNSSK